MSYYIFGPALEQMCDSMTTTIAAKRRVSAARSALPSISCESGIVDHPSLRDCLTQYFAIKRFGLYVFGGAACSGKSTMLKVVIDKFRSGDSKRTVLYFENGGIIIRNKSLHETLGIAENCSISSAIKPGTVIVLDHVYFSTLPGTDCGCYLQALARESYESQNFQLLVVVSDAELMRYILKLQGLTVKLLCAPDLLKWSSGQVIELVRDVFEHWTEPERAKLAEVIMQCPLAGAVCSTEETSRHRASFRGSALTHQDIVQLATERADRRVWEAFNCIRDTIQYICLLPHQKPDGTV